MWKKRRKTEAGLAELVYFAEIIVHRLGDDYIVPKWRLADQVADIVRPLGIPFANTHCNNEYSRCSWNAETYRVYRGEIILADEYYFEYPVDKREREYYLANIIIVINSS